MSKIAYILENFGFRTKEMGDDKCMLEKTEEAQHRITYEEVMNGI
jgi:hypothetical protein